jgi:hypothetical protein
VVKLKYWDINTDLAFVDSEEDDESDEKYYTKWWYNYKTNLSCRETQICSNDNLTRENGWIEGYKLDYNLFRTKFYENLDDQEVYDTIDEFLEENPECSVATAYRALKEVLSSEILQDYRKYFIKYEKFCFKKWCMNNGMKPSFEYNIIREPYARVSLEDFRKYNLDSKQKMYEMHFYYTDSKKETDERFKKICDLLDSLSNHTVKNIIRDDFNGTVIQEKCDEGLMNKIISSHKNFLPSHWLRGESFYCEKAEWNMFWSDSKGKAKYSAIVVFLQITKSEKLTEQLTNTFFDKLISIVEPFYACADNSKKYERYRYKVKLAELPKVYKKTYRIEDKVPLEIEYMHLF